VEDLLFWIISNFANPSSLSPSRLAGSEEQPAGFLQLPAKRLPASCQWEQARNGIMAKAYDWVGIYARNDEWRAVTP
jgi:hypothetical protein